jgi:dTDP-glucose 4,6-dehydratase
MVLDYLKKPKSLITHIDDRPGQVARHISSTSKMKDLIGFTAKTPFEAGLEETIKWYSDNREWWERLLWMKSIPMRLVDGKRVIY